jgi:hypothetical protein
MVNQDGCAVLNLRTGIITTLNETGMFIWCALGRGKEPNQIIEDLACEAGVESHEIRTDVLDFLSVMKKEHLLAE